MLEYLMAANLSITVRVRSIPGLALVLRMALIMGMPSVLRWALEHWPFWVKVGNQPWERVT